MANKWESKLCGCCENPGACLVSFFVPGGFCCLSASAVNKVTGNGTCLPYMLVCCFHHIGGAFNRETIRTQLGIDGTFCNSYCLWCFCLNCAAVQEYREASIKGSQQA